MDMKPHASGVSATDLSNLLSRATPELIQELLFGSDRVRLLQQQKRPIAEHLAGFRAHLESNRGDAKHVNQTARYLRMMIGLCHVSYWWQLDEERIRKALVVLGAKRSRRKWGRGRRSESSDIGLSTLNHYLTAMKTFCNWMVNQGRAERSPAKRIKPFPARTDPRHPRRALTTDEMVRLVAAAQSGRKIAGITGAERAVIYLLCATTGLRVNEVATLTRRSFKLDGKSSYLSIRASNAKGKRETKQFPLREDVTAMLASYMASADPDRELFRYPSNSTYALKKDLAAAGIPYVLDGEFADNHAQRHTFISNLFDSGATPKEAQTLARHQDARLTLAIYAHVRPAAQRAAVERLPSFGAAQPAKVSQIQAPATDRRA